LCRFLHILDASMTREGSGSFHYFESFREVRD